MIRRISTWLWLGGLFILCQWLAPAGMAPLNAAQASVAGITCQGTITDINFGNVDASTVGIGLLNGNSNLQTTGFLTYYCTNTTVAQKDVVVCIGLGNPSGTPTRSLSGPAGSVLNYQLFKDASNTNSWGSSTGQANWGTPYVRTISVPAGGTSTPVTEPIYATITSDQSFWGGGAGSYGALYGPGNVAFDIGPSGGQCTPGGGSIEGFKVSANMQATCNVQTNPLVFPTPVNGDPSNTTATATLTVTCNGFFTQHTGYRVGLDNGLHYSGNVRHMLGGPTHSDLIGYQLYQDGGNNTVWGYTDQIDTQTSQQGTKTFTVYGKVEPNQGLPPAGDYFDVVTVYVYY
ncbi:Csu type fimbrial protein [Frateuria terrea]|uniref:Spore coat protein U (SCPU) domain-containing protein n=1 Tax=Frateuria terrea TaxID=529704 RepID=A0A1H6S9A3_9GAMM|nr:spore coat U domain-containing protein [Frateuria terrea]SEI64603.1 Spore coat protein U (SCPU) domain-containing protein [Frateuria terrea]SFP24711.1 Spore coat protein U (SCPU) domain-containing protein [Frateuria terrea]